MRRTIVSSSLFLTPEIYNAADVRRILVVFDPPSFDRRFGLVPQFVARNGRAEGFGFSPAAAAPTEYDSTSRFRAARPGGKQLASA
jgi:hypothetical protein